MCNEFISNDLKNQKGPKKGQKRSYELDNGIKKENYKLLIFNVYFFFIFLILKIEIKIETKIQAGEVE